MKDGDQLLEKLRQAVKRRDDIAIMVFAVFYEPPWWYWVDYGKINHN